MPTIEVLHPFGLRLDSSTPRRDFVPGVHEVTDDELAHWFMQACLNDKRAVLVTDEALVEEGQATDGNTVYDLRDFEIVNPEELARILKGMTNAKLTDLIKEHGFPVPAKATKANLVAAILDNVGPSQNLDQDMDEGAGPEQNAGQNAEQGGEQGSDEATVHSESDTDQE